jgi:hypothetical protein
VKLFENENDLLKLFCKISYICNVICIMMHRKYCIIYYISEGAPNNLYIAEAPRAQIVSSLELEKLKIDCS